MLIAALSLLCWGAIISGIIVRLSVSKHVDRSRIATLDDPSRAFSLIGPSHEVLTAKGKRLLTTNYVLFGGGFLVAFLSAAIQRILH